MRFAVLAPPRTYVTKLYTPWSLYVSAHLVSRTSSGWFACTEPSQTTSLQGIQGVQGALCTGSGRFKGRAGVQGALCTRSLRFKCVCTALTRGRAVSDATLQVAVTNHWYTVGTWEFKNEFKHITSEPHAQNLAYGVHLHQDPDLHQDRAPFVVGCHHFQVFGAAWHGSKVYSDPLCSPGSLLFVPRGRLW